MKQRTVLSLILLLFCTTAFYGQNRKAKKAYKKGYEYHAIGNTHMAITYYDKAIDEYYEYGEVYLLRAECYLKLSKNNKTKREEYINKVVEDLTNSIKFGKSRSNVVSSYRGRGDIHLYDNSFDAALADYYDALEYVKEGTMPNAPYLYFRLGLANYKKGKHTEALENFKQAESEYEYSKNNEYHYIVKGNNFQKMGKSEEAIKCYKLANEMSNIKKYDKWGIVAIGYCFHKILADEVLYAKKLYKITF